jgi:hypothetical protein
MAYHRLLISSVTDELADIVTRVIDVDERSDYRLAVRCLVRVWREATFTETPQYGTLESVNAFVLDFDLCYPLRRLGFLREKVDVELRRNRTSQGDLRRVKAVINEQWQVLRRLSKQLRSPAESPLRDLLRPQGTRSPLNAESPFALAGSAESRLQDSEIPFPITWEDLDRILGRGTEGEASRGEWDAEPTQKAQEECESRAAAFIGATRGPGKTRVAELFDAIAATIRGVITEEVQKADAACLAALGMRDMPDNPRGLNKDSLLYYFLNYDLFDMITFPILYETGIGEVDNVEVVRISPEDAVCLIDEKKASCLKLAGTGLWHFGAFMDTRWRKNDILWGRLDGTERIIKAMLPGHDDLRTLIGEAQAMIICEALEAPDGVARLGDDEKYCLLAESMMRTKEKRSNEEALLGFIRQVLQHAAPRERARLMELINVGRLGEVYRENFKTQSRLPPEETLRTMARTSTVVGRMLEGLTEKYGRGQKYAAYLVRLGRIFWGLVEVSVPQSIWNLLARYWLFLLYLAEILLFVGALLFGPDQLRNLALKLFLLTLLVDAVILSLNSVMSRRPWWHWLRRVILQEEEKVGWRRFLVRSLFAVVALCCLALLTLAAVHLKDAVVAAASATAEDIRSLWQKLCNLGWLGWRRMWHLL